MLRGTVTLPLCLLTLACWPLFVKAQGCLDEDLATGGTKNRNALLKKVTVDKKRFPLATCNDNSSAIYYLRREPSSPNWVIYMVGGELCATREKCKQRIIKAQWQTSSNTSVYCDSFAGKTVLDTDARKNPQMYNWNHVYIPYCTSDLYIGRTLHPVFSDGVRFVFRGAFVIEAILNELTNKHGLSDHPNGSILFTGSSAGGIGALYHTIQAAQNFNHSKLAVILDSAWFVNYRNFFSYFLTGEDANLISLLNLKDTALCNVTDGLTSAPCCTVSSCLVSSLAHSKGLRRPSILLIQSGFDAYPLSKLQAEKPHEYNTPDSLNRFLNGYSGYLNRSLEIALADNRDISLFQTNCGKHTYLTGTTFYTVLSQGGQAETDVSLFDGGVVYNQGISEKYWEEVVTKNCLLKDFISAWVASGYSSKTLACAGNSSHVLFDDCLGFNCNPTCPDRLTNGKLPEGWPDYGEVITIILAVWIIVECIICKLLLCYKAYAAKKLHKAFAKNLKREHNELKEKIRNNRQGADLIDDGIDECKARVTIACKEISFVIQVPIETDETAEPPTPTSTLTHTCEERRKSYAKSRNGLSHLSRRLSTEEKKKDKFILQNVTVHFHNPGGRIIAIMGPSGSGKTTFLNVLTGRVIDENQSGRVLVRGHGLDEPGTRSWYRSNMGYTLQLASPYYDELTVRENLLFCALMRLPRSMDRQEIFRRVEMVIREVGLLKAANTKVEVKTKKGSSGISGGQKRKLCVAIQLLSYPTVLFLDEPTSGLDASASLELLQMLSVVKSGGRLIILTIHQPRPEIYKMFDRILFLCNGKVAFFGRPNKAPNFFFDALETASPEALEKVKKKQAIEQTNAADIVMDLLNEKDNQEAILEHFMYSGEQVRHYNCVCRDESDKNKPVLPKPGQKDESGQILQKSTPMWRRQFIAMEGRLCRQRWTDFAKIGYIPAALLLYSLGLGFAYLNADRGFTILACFSLFTAASFLFVSPAISAVLLPRCHHVFMLEREDGVCRPSQLVLHTFLHMTSITTLPILAGTLIVFSMVIDFDWTWSMYSLVALINLTVNGTSMAMVILAVCAAPEFSEEIVHILCAATAFFEGFLYPLGSMPSWLSWVIYINPLYWAFAGEMRVILGGQTLPCPRSGGISEIECLDKMGNVILKQFDLEDANPYESLIILLAMTVVYLLSAVLSLTPVIRNIRGWYQKYFGKEMRLPMTSSKKKIPVRSSVFSRSLRGSDSSSLLRPLSVAAANEKWAALERRESIDENGANGTGGEAAQILSLYTARGREPFQRRGQSSCEKSVKFRQRKGSMSESGAEIVCDSSSSSEDEKKDKKLEDAEGQPPNDGGQRLRTSMSQGDLSRHFARRWIAKAQQGSQSADNLQELARAEAPAPFNRRMSRASNLLRSVLSKWQDAVYESKLERRQVNAAHQVNKRGEAVQKSLAVFLQRISEHDSKSAALNQKRSRVQRERDMIRKTREKGKLEIPLLAGKRKAAHKKCPDNDRPSSPEAESPVVASDPFTNTAGGSLKLDLGIDRDIQQEDDVRKRATSDVSYLAKTKNITLSKKRERLKLQGVSEVVDSVEEGDHVDFPRAMSRRTSAPSSLGVPLGSLPVRSTTSTNVEDVVLSQALAFDSSPRARKQNELSQTPESSSPGTSSPPTIRVSLSSTTPQALLHEQRQQSRQTSTPGSTPEQGLQESVQTGRNRLTSNSGQRQPLRHFSRSVSANETVRLQSVEEKDEDMPPSLLAVHQISHKPAQPAVGVASRTPEVSTEDVILHKKSIESAV